VSASYKTYVDHLLDSQLPIKKSGGLEAGMHEIPVEMYHADPAPQPSLSASGIKLLIGQSPDHFRARHPRLSPFPWYRWPQSDAMKLGTIAHRIILGAGSEYLVLDPADFLTKDGKPGKTLGTAGAKAAREDAEARGLLVIDPESYRDALNATKNMEALIARDYPRWDSGVSERTMLWQYRLNSGDSVWCRTLPDRFVASCTCVEKSGIHPHVFDPKFTSIPINDYAIDNTIASSGWDIQDAFYTMGVEKIVGDHVKGHVLFTFLVAELFPPFEVRAVTVPENWRQSARGEIDIAANKFGECLASGKWPGRGDRYVPIGPPDWLAARRGMLDEIVAGEE
jgi:hypothetical protein